MECVKTYNRVHKARGVSLPDDMYANVVKRLHKLHPWVKGFSQYIQCLVDLDLKHHLINEDGRVNESVVNREKGRKRPFEPGRSSVLGEPGLSTS